MPESKRMIDQLASGPAVALEIRQDDAVDKFRQLCGPYDPEIAKKLEPQSLRAKYGSDRVRNAVHCTDLPEDGRLEVNFIFSTLIEWCLKYLYLEVIDIDSINMINISSKPRGHIEFNAFVICFGNVDHVQLTLETLMSKFGDNRLKIGSGSFCLACWLLDGAE